MAKSSSSKIEPDCVIVEEEQRIQLQTERCCFLRHLSFPKPSTVPIPTPSTVPISTPSTVPIPTPSTVPIPRPSTVPIPRPSTVPIPRPSTVPIPRPSTVPLPRPSTVPIPTPSTVTIPRPSTVPIPWPSTVPIPRPSTVPIPWPSTVPIPWPSTVPIPRPSTVPIPRHSCPAKKDDIWFFESENESKFNDYRNCDYPIKVNKRRTKRAVLSSSNVPQSQSDINLNEALNECPEFNVLDFVAFWEKKERLFAAKRLEILRKDPTHKFFYSDEYIRNELFEKFGEIDTENDLYQKIFKNYKEGFFARIRKCETEEENIAKAMDLKADLEERVYYTTISFDYNVTPAKIEKHINDLFGDKLELYEKMDPLRNKWKVDFIDVNRPNTRPEYWLSDTITVSLLKHPDSDNHKLMMRKVLSTEITVEKDIPEVPNVNLAVVDPKYFEFPYFTKQDANSFISRSFAWMLNSTLHSFKNGVESYTFLQRVKQIIKHAIDLKAFHLSTETEMFELLPDIFHIEEDKKAQCGRILLMPSSFEDQILDLPTRKLFITHRILQILSSSPHPYFRIEDIRELFLSELGIEFDYEDWGYGSAKEFVEDHISKIKTVEIRVNCLPLSNSRIPSLSFGNGVEHYLVHLNHPNLDEEYSKIMCCWTEYEAFGDSAQSEDDKPISIPSVYMSNFDRFPCVSNNIHKGEVKLAVCTSYFSPSKFHVIRLSNKEILEEFQRHEVQNKIHQMKQPKLTDNMISVKLPVLVLMDEPVDPTLTRKEWFRAIVLASKKDEKAKTFYKILQVDFGAEGLESLDNIRLIPKELGNALEAQAIGCKIKLSKKFEMKHKKQNWTRDEKKIFQDLISSGHLYLKFEHEDAGIWIVSIKIVDKINNQIMEEDLSIRFERELSKMASKKSSSI